MVLYACARGGWGLPSLATTPPAGQSERSSGAPGVTEESWPRTIDSCFLLHFTRKFRVETSTRAGSRGRPRQPATMASSGNADVQGGATTASSAVSEHAPSSCSSEKDLLELAKEMDKLCGDAKRTARELLELCARYSTDVFDIETIERISKHLGAKVQQHTGAIDRLQRKIGREQKKASPSVIAVVEASLNMATAMGKKSTMALSHAVRDLAEVQEQHIRRHMKLLHPKANELTDDEIGALKQRVKEVGSATVLAQETLKKKETHTRVAHHLMVESNEVHFGRGSCQAQRAAQCSFLSSHPSH